MKKLINRKANHFGKEGFTLIELLVVIAIIGLLSTMAVLALGDARQKTRDAKRQSDLKVLQTAIELYVSDNGSVPAPTDWGITAATSLEDILATYLPGGLPEDPSGTPRDWVYCFNATSNKYLVATTLERTTPEVTGDIDTVTGWAEATECISSDAASTGVGVDMTADPDCTDAGAAGVVDDDTGIAVCLGSDDN